MKISLIVVAALAVSYLLRTRPAALRHWVLAAGIVCAGAVPVLETVVPRWTLPFAAPTPFERYEEEAHVASQAASSRHSPAGSAPASESARVEAAISSISLPVEDVLWITWIAGVILSVCLLLIGALRLAWLAAGAERITQGRWHELVREISDRYGIARQVVLLQSEHPSLMVTWGVRQPKVVLPAGAQAWSEDRARIVLSHELAHVQRGDWLVQMTAELLRAIYWFNPLLWIACRRLRLESEHACDDEVINRGADGADYANHLVELARALHQRRNLWLPAAAMARPSSLERRVRAMLNSKLDRGHINSFTRAAVFAVLLAAATVLAAAQSGFSSFSGSIVDEQGRGIPSTPVVLSNEARQAKYEVKTNSEGRFEFVGLPGGDYAVEVRGNGFQPLKDMLTVPGPNLQRRYMLKLGTLQETITLKFDPNEKGSTNDPEPAPRVREVPMPARKECTLSTSGGRIVPPKKIRDVWPRYPRGLQGTGTEGTVVMEARIGVDGYVNDIKLIGDANAELAHAAIAAVRDWRYTETLLNCEPVEVTMTVTTNFQRTPPPPPTAPPPGAGPR